MLVMPEGEDWCLSGGAKGADAQWGMTAGMAGHKVVHFSFSGHKTHVPAEEVVVLKPEMLRTADQFCSDAAKVLKRRFPTKSLYTTNLMRRNYFQIRDSNGLYAVSTFNEKREIEGGTAWAVEMFLKKNEYRACRAYFFDQVECHWYAWAGEWISIYEPPVPKGIWTGIGTRELNTIGKLAIRVLMGYDARKAQLARILKG